MIKVGHIRFLYLRITETFMYEEMRNLVRYEPVVLCGMAKNLDVFPLKNIKSLSYLNPISFGFNGLYWRLFKHCPYFTKVINDEDIKILHAQYGREGTYSISLKEKCKVPLITNFRGWDASTIPAQHPGIYNELFKKGNLFLARSRDMKKDLIRLGCPEEKIIVHHSSIDVKKFRFIARKPVDKNEKIKILMIGRFVETKGFPYALKAFAKVKERYENMSFTIIGDGALRSEIEDLIRGLDITSDVRLLGFQSPERVREEMYSSHIYMSPSITDRRGEKEGTVVAIAEAQFTGMPTLGTWHAGIPETIVDKKTGFLVKEKDVDALADRLNYLVEHQDLWETLGKNGRKHIEKEFNIYVQTRKLEKIYDSVLGR